MDFSAQLDSLQKHLTDAQTAAQSAATESRDKLKQQIDTAHDDVNRAVSDAKLKQMRALATQQVGTTEG